MAWGALLGGALGAVGSIIGGRSQERAARRAANAARFDPYNVSTGMGTTRVVGDPGNQIIQYEPTSLMAALRGGLGTGARDQLTNALGMGLPSTVGVEEQVNAFLGQQDMTTPAALSLAQALGGQSSAAQQLGLSGINSAFGGPSAAGLTGLLSGAGQSLLGQAGTAPSASAFAGQFAGMAPGLLSQAGGPSAMGAAAPFMQGGGLFAGPGVGDLEGRFGSLGAAGMGAAMTPGQASAAAQGVVQPGQGAVQSGLSNLFNLSGTAARAGQDMMARRGGTFNNLAAQRLRSLREGARPAEERAIDQRLNALFSQGRLGTTGGSQVLGELALQQELADQNRIVESQNFAQQQQNVEAQQALQAQGLGANLLGQAQQGAAQGISAGQNLLGLSLGSEQFGRSLGAQLGQFGLGQLPGLRGMSQQQAQFLSSLGEQQRGTNLQAALSAAGQDQARAQALSGLGLNLAQMGLSGVNADQALAMQQAGLGRGLLGDALGGIAMDQQQARGLGALGTSLFGMAPGMQQNIFRALGAADQQQMARGAQRIAAAEGLFGFGNQLRNQEMDRALQLLGGLQSMDQEVRAQMALGLEGGAQQASAGSRAGGLFLSGGGGFSPMGSALQGLGTGLGNVDFGGLFGGGGSPAPGSSAWMDDLLDF